MGCPHVEFGSLVGTQVYKKKWVIVYFTMRSTFSRYNSLFWGVAAGVETSNTRRRPPGWGRGRSFRWPVTRNLLLRSARPVQLARSPPPKSSRAALLVVVHLKGVKVPGVLRHLGSTLECDYLDCSLHLWKISYRKMGSNMNLQLVFWVHQSSLGRSWHVGLELRLLSIFLWWVRFPPFYDEKYYGLGGKACRGH